MNAVELETRVVRLLAGLGDDSAEIAAQLAEAGVTGRRGCADRCVLAVYLMRRLSREGLAVDIAVSQEEITVWLDGGSVEFAPPPAVRQFISDFDCSVYPALVAGWFEQVGGGR